MIYFIREDDDGPIKIGCSASYSGVRERLTTIKIGNPRKLSIIKIIPGNFEDEKKWHERYAYANVSGEWFSPVPELVNEINNLVYPHDDQKIMDKITILSITLNDLQLIARKNNISFGSESILKMYKILCSQGLLP